MTDPERPRAAGWYPDRTSGGTRYWDGARWTGDERPPRRTFAASSDHKIEGGLAIFLGLMFSFIIVMGVLEDDGMSPAALAVIPVIVGATGLLGIYLLRGQGPTTEAVQARLATEQREARKRRRASNMAVAASRLFGGRSDASSVDAAEAKRVEVLADPQTSKSLQSLQNLLYTRALTDAEYEVAKQKLLGPSTVDPLEQITQLAELHRSGILGDIEFADAKARVLGIG